MTKVTVVIPTYNHARYLPDAIESALDQRHVDVEVVVVDDGSEDETPHVTELYAVVSGGRVRPARTPHLGVSAARNYGLWAARGEYVTFLDADDVIDPMKVAVQAATLDLDRSAGWCYCDVLIVEDRTSVRASDRYGYAQRETEGWLHSDIALANFIPVMAPLVRRSACPGFPDGDLEDWAWLRALSAVQRARYVPRVLAMYRRLPSGRNVTQRLARLRTARAGAKA